MGCTHIIDLNVDVLARKNAREVKRQLACSCNKITEFEEFKSNTLKLYCKLCKQFSLVGTNGVWEYN